MLMCFAGRERTVDELADLAAGCGLRAARHDPGGRGAPDATG
jgi:hypothetical protein